MQNALKTEIKRLSKRALSRTEAKQQKEEEYRRKFRKRTGMEPGVSTSQGFPTFDRRHFDPVYCARNANFLSKTIWHKVLQQQYAPLPAVNFQIPKPDGGTRSIMSFAIPDAALANVLLKRMRNRNLKKLSPNSFAYHPDRNVFDAIIALKDFPENRKMFSVQIDFQKYFDQIPTGYLRRLLSEREKVSVTRHERHILDEFMNHQYSPASEYASLLPKRRTMGTPQGSSISLFLANLANDELDRSLSVISGKFVRFADDVVALCESYANALEVERSFLSHCEESGLIINKEKSPGITVIDRVDQELRTAKSFDYLGYQFSRDGLAVPEKVVRRIKSKVSRLANIYLITYPRKYGFSEARVNSGDSEPNYDWDLLGFISEVRGYMYGGLFEDEIRRFISEGAKLRQMRGLMGFYALIEDRETLRQLDGWLVNFVRRAVRTRQRILSNSYGVQGLAPNNLELIDGSWLDTSSWDGDDVPDSRLPSFVRGWRASRKFYLTFGLEGVEPPNYFAYY